MQQKGADQVPVRFHPLHTVVQCSQCGIVLTLLHTCSCLACTSCSRGGCLQQLVLVTGDSQTETYPPECMLSDQALPGSDPEPSLSFC